VVNPVHAPTPEDDPERGPERSEPISKVSDSGTTSALAPRGGTEEKSAKHKVGKHRRPPKKQPLWRELLTLLVIALVLTFLIQHFLGRVYSIPSGSMEQTLHGCPGCTGDRVLVDKLVYDFRDPKPGDVVVFEGPASWTENDTTPQGSSNAFVRGMQWLGSLVGLAPPDERDFVKRVVAVGGQTVQCCDQKWRVVVDGRPLDEPYVYWMNGKPDGRQRFDPVVVPEGTLWVMGDNRSDSCDSRCQGGGGVRGVVPIDNVIGKVRAIVLPPNRWRGVGDHNPQAGIPFALSAPGWQQGGPLGLGIVAAWPTLWLGRKMRRRHR
jgi:signal peptidase I